MCVHVPTEARRGLGFLEAGVTGVYEPPSVCAGNQMLFLCGGAGTPPLSYFSGPGKLFLPLSAAAHSAQSKLLFLNKPHY